MTTKMNLTPEAAGLIVELTAWRTRLNEIPDPLSPDEVKALLSCVMRVQGFISYANRENRRLVRERDASVNALVNAVREHFTSESV